MKLKIMLKFRDWNYIFIMRFKLLETRMHGVLDKTMYHQTRLILREIGSDLGQLHDLTFFSTANRNCPVTRFLKQKTSLGYFAEECLE